MSALAGVVAVLCGVGGALLHAANAAADRTVQPSFWLMGVAAAIGWGSLAVALRASSAGLLRALVAGIGLAQGVAVLAAEVALAHPAGALGEWAAWFGSWLWTPGYVAVVTVLPLLMPDGTLLSRRWRPLLLMALAAVGVVAAGWALTPYDAQDFPAALEGQTNPVGLQAVADLLAPLGAVLLLGAVPAAVAALVLRQRRARGLVRQQLKWVLLGVLATLALMALSRLAPVLVGEPLAALAMLPLPVAIGVAVLRHGLWEVDVVLSRTVLYLLLTGIAASAYVLLVGPVGQILDDETAGATLTAAAVALLVLPVHAFLRRQVNRWVHGWEVEPYEVLTRLGHRLEDVGEIGSADDRLLPSVVTSVARAMRADRATLRLGDGTVLVAHGSAAESVPGPAAGPAAAPDVESVLEIPLRYAGDRLGTLSVERSGGFTWNDRAVLDRLGGQTAIAAHTVLLERAARAAREEAVLAREEERRRLRHDLHDGIGPSLAALALQVETARDLAPDDPAAATALLGRLVPRLNAAVAEVRALVNELRPPTLDELGLASAVRELTARLSTPDTEVRTATEGLAEGLADGLADGGGRPLPAAVEVAAYRIAGEAATNAVRHAAARHVDVLLHREPDRLRVEVRDDGTGLRDGAPRGVGLTSMRMRAEELGGTLTVSTSPHGTTVTASLPLSDPTDLTEPTDQKEVR
ncbi:sensor histidine kinase [Nocardioides mesophilus]|uniref:Oxygen sensor histidine kinase NreB n=1 Tax=Nocardioides mesophilus TaxID=433659 RepID=A0A7G9RFH8_9ACTN|nr:sensor histidine kinase [Nocardioides mesophilus]QNN54353.1 sensor histidine kinase [Nocardioides mesophilus]